MKLIEDLIKNNQQWAEQRKQEEPDYFANIAKGQAPKVMWIGCSDSRLSAEHILQVQPGEFFVQRNVANMVCHTDLNVITALSFAVDVLKVEHVIVCGHSRCGGCQAGFTDHTGLVDNWLQHVRDVIHLHDDELSKIKEDNERVTRLAELNVLHQILNLGHTTVIREAWQKKQTISIHPWFYDLEKGTVRVIGDSIANPEELTVFQKQLFK
tara:strand:- start:327 stop:959 length:633 start_codon:yes stop_codon:yes gene_type:complete